MRMQWKKQQVLLLTIILVLVAYLLFQKNGKMHYALPSLDHVDKSELTKIKLSRSGADLVLEKQDGRWLIEPQGYPADESAVNGMLGQIAGLSLSALVSENDALPVYALDPEHRIAVRAFAGDALRRSFLIGKPAGSGRHTFVKLDGKKGIFHAGGDLRRTFDVTSSGLRDKVVMRVGGDVQRLVFSRGKRSLTIVAANAAVKKDKNEKAATAGAGPAWKTAAGKPVNDQVVNGIISSLRNLVCDDFPEGKKKSDFSHPVFTVTLTGQKTYTVSLYRAGKGSYAGLSSESEYPFRLSDWKARQIMKEFKDLTG